ncbi:hypothetical protein D3C73_784330 [compost metagenome]
MSLEQQLRQSLRKKAEGWSAPPDLKVRILNRITPEQRGRRMKRWLIATVVATALIIPAGAYAGYSYLADSVYVSQRHFMEIGGTVEAYDVLEGKLKQAKDNLSEADYTALTALLHKIGEYNLKIADAQGMLHPDKLSRTDLEIYRELAAQLEPYARKLEQAPVDNAPVTTLDSNTFWKQQLTEGERIFNGGELASFRQLISEVQSYESRITDQDGSAHPERLTEEETMRYKKVYEELAPYLKQLGIMIKPGP